MKTILALQPNARLIGYALFEGRTLIDWGGKDRRAEPTLRGTVNGGLAYLGRLLQRHDPDVIVLPKRTRSGQTARNRFLTAIRRDLSRRPHVVVSYGRRDVRKSFGPFLKSERPNKQSIMELLVRWFPELLGVLPTPRRPWDCQDHSIPMFDAVSLAVTYLHHHHEPTAN